jgi:hypothetical protein
MAYTNDLISTREQLEATALGRKALAAWEAQDDSAFHEDQWKDYERWHEQEREELRTLKLVTEGDR